MITLATLKDATAQEVFDQIANHLLTQNAKCESSGLCVYKNEKGLKCAAGCLIAENEYVTDFETNLWDKLSIFGVPTNHQELISDLQHIHDTFGVKYWKEHLEVCALQNQLNFNF